ncbi:hypothetical protein ONE63_003691 [Megalurothrips usitatus]|uniref:Uncharacterized protein n=1 Tax=Megalurothrips usitatus TaxID=439358 RepID=A0AAV7X7D7_9NEOP|nr:hypothetical protein ONE63_003691 [Megalurothrips usitatus]
MKRNASLAVLALVLVVVLAAPAVLGRPPHRQKRVSDQRLGELEALIALQKLRGKLVTVPVGFGRINPNEYGRKRRSAPSSNEATILERILEAQQAQDDVQDVYDELVANPSDGQRYAYERERPQSAFNRPVTE